MNRPIIKGTTHHKASMAKATAQSVVSQSRTKADAGLIAASNALGKSYKPSEIDFELDKINIDVPEKKEKKPLTPEEQAAKDARKAKRKAKRKEIGGNIVDGVKTAIGGIVGVPLAIGNGLFKFGEDIIDKFGNKVEEAIDDIKTKGAEGKEKRAEKKAAKEAAALAEQQASEEARFDELMVEDEEENDFSAIEAEPDVDYESSGAVDRGYKTWKHKQDEENIRSARETSDRLNQSTDAQRQDAAKKHNVKVEDLEAKEIGGKKEFFPKQNVVGGKEETQWDDKLGRFKNPEITAAVGEEAEKAAVEEMKPKFPKGMDPNLATTGEIALNYDTNTYEYTQQYFDRLAKEKIDQQKVVEPVVEETTTEPVIEEKKTLSNLEIRKKKMADKKWNDPNTSQYIKDQMLKEGYVPNEGKTAMKMRDNRIYRNAVKGGIVQQNMIKSGYIPE